MYSITIDGLNGAISTSKVAEAIELVETLLHGGYSVNVNALRVRLFYGPGYDSVMWDEGDFVGQTLTESAIGLNRHDRHIQCECGNPDAPWHDSDIEDTTDNVDYPVDEGMWGDCV